VGWSVDAQADSISNLRGNYGHHLLRDLFGLTKFEFVCMIPSFLDKKLYFTSENHVIESATLILLLCLNFFFRKYMLSCHRMKPALFQVLCEIKEKTGY